MQLDNIKQTKNNENNSTLLNSRTRSASYNNSKQRLKVKEWREQKEKEKQKLIKEAESK